MSEIPNVLPHLNSLRDAWRQQNFNFTRSQKEEYEILLSTRRDRVKELYTEGRVSKSRPKVAIEY